MGKEYGSTQIGERTPQVKFTRENETDAPAGSYFVGTKVGEKWIDETSIVFDFILEDAHENTPILLKQADKSWKEAEVGPNSKVSIFGSKSEKGRLNQIADKLLQVPNGTKIKVTFNGKKQNPKTKRYFNDFTVVDA